MWMIYRSGDWTFRSSANQMRHAWSCGAIGVSVLSKGLKRRSLFPQRGLIHLPRVAAKPLPWEVIKPLFHSLKGIDNQWTGCSSPSGMRRMGPDISHGSALPHNPGLTNLSPSGNKKRPGDIHLWPLRENNFSKTGRFTHHG